MEVPLSGDSSGVKQSSKRLLGFFKNVLLRLKLGFELVRRPDLHKLSAVDATSFSIMKRERITLAYTFDYHFAVAGFRLIG